MIDQVQTDVSLISFISVIAVFFIGSLLPEFKSYDLSVKIPISFFIVATFAFLFSALILSNTTHHIVAGDFKKTEKFLTYGYAISEYMGVFLFVLSIPLALSIVTADIYLRIVTFTAAILGISFYQFMGFSLLERHFSKRHRFIAVATVLFGTVLFISQVYAFHFTLISVAFLAFIFIITALAPLRNVQ